MPSNSAFCIWSRADSVECWTECTIENGHKRENCRLCPFRAACALSKMFWPARAPFGTLYSATAFFRRRRAKPAIPTKPVAISVMLAGSGVAVTGELNVAWKVISTRSP